MAREEAFQPEGSVIEALPNGTWRVELSNGHRLLGFVSGRVRQSVGPLQAGDKVRLKMSPFDLSTGRIVGKSTI